MAHSKGSGRRTLIRGTLSYLWEEIKTMNGNKIRAMGNIFRGYLRMKLSKRKERPRMVTTGSK